MKTPLPRQGSYLEMAIHSTTWPDGTWLEGEEFSYPSDGRCGRKALATCEDGKKRIISCGMADTFFSIPGHVKINGKRVKGFLSSGEHGMKFTAFTPREKYDEDGHKILPSD